MARRRWRLSLVDDEPAMLPEGTDVEVLSSGVLHLVTTYNGELVKESYLAPGAWVEVITYG